MSDVLRKSAAWLGFISDDRYTVKEEHEDLELTEPVYGDDYYDEEEIDETGVRPMTRPQVVATPRAVDLSRIVTVHPRTYNEARTIGEHYRDGLPVIMNLTDMEDSDAKRLVDFAAGLVFGLRGTIERVTSKVFLL
ncbi:MAG: cell division protein SepF, partial [Propionibacteriaceae bacterium]